MARGSLVLIATFNKEDNPSQVETSCHLSIKKVLLHFQVSI